MPVSESADPIPEEQSWTIEFEYEFEFEFDGVRTNADAERLGEAFVDEAIRTAILAELRERRKLAVQVGTEGAYGRGSVRTYGIARILAKWRDVPAVKDAFEKVDWFWIQLQIALSTKLGREIVVERVRAQLVGAYPGGHLSAGARRALLRRGRPIPPNRNGLSLTLWDRLNAAAKLAVAVPLLLLPYACDYLDRREEERRWHAHDADQSVSVEIVVSRQPAITEIAPRPPIACRSPVRVTSHDGEGFKHLVVCADH